MNESSDGCRSFGNGSGSALRTVDVMGAGSPCARADRTPASSISADIARYSSGGKRTICSRVHTDTPPGTNPRIPRGCCIEVSTTRQPGAGCDARREGCTLDPTRAVVIAPRRRGDVGVSRRILRWEGRARCRRGCVPRSVRTAGRRVPLTRLPLTGPMSNVFRERHFGGARGGMMTTVWRPRVRIPVPNIDGADVDEKRRDESTTKGTKRKRAPPTKPRAMRARGEASLEVQGVQRLSARS